MNNVDKAKGIKLLILDVDGILTSGVIYYGDDGSKLKGFHTHDGIGIKLLKKAGVDIAIISAKESQAVTLRMQELNVEHVYLGFENKLPIYEELKNKLQLTDQEIAYMGDDLPDLPVLARAGLAITVEPAAEIIKQHADYITKVAPGEGAVREASVFILRAKGLYDSVVQSYLPK